MAQKRIALWLVGLPLTPLHNSSWLRNVTLLHAIVTVEEANYCASSKYGF
jgi:hypothetical protein